MQPSINLCGDVTWTGRYINELLTASISHDAGLDRTPPEPPTCAQKLGSRHIQLPARTWRRRCRRPGPVAQDDAADARSMPTAAEAGVELSLTCRAFLILI